MKKLFVLAAATLFSLNAFAMPQPEKLPIQPGGSYQGDAAHDTDYSAAVGPFQTQSISLTPNKGFMTVSTNVCANGDIETVAFEGLYYGQEFVVQMNINCGQWIATTSPDGTYYEFAVGQDLQIAGLPPSFTDAYITYAPEEHWLILYIVSYEREGAPEEYVGASFKFDQQ